MCAQENNTGSRNDRHVGDRALRSKVALVPALAIAILVLTFASLLWPAHRLTYAASGFGTDDQAAMASPDVCVGGNFLTQVTPFGFLSPNPFLTFNPGTIVTISPNSFFNSSDGLQCITSCSRIPTVLLPGICSAPPASITSTSSLSTTSCGSNENLSFSVINTFGLAVLDGTNVTFATSLGTVTPSTTTNGGVAVASLQIPPRQSGVAQIQAFTGGVSTQKTISVSC